MSLKIKHILILTISLSIAVGRLDAQNTLQERIDSALFYDAYADICADEGRFREAGQNYMKAYNCYPPELDELNPLIRPVFCQKTAAMMSALAEYSGALTWLERAESMLGPDADEVFTAALKSTKAGLKSYLGESSEAVALWKEAMALGEYGTPDYALTAENLADALTECGSYDEAINLLTMDALHPGSTLRDSIYVYRKIARALAMQGKRPQAENYLAKSMEWTLKSSADDTYMLAGQYETSAFVHEISGHYPQAYEEYSRACAGFDTVFGAEHPGSIACRMGMAKSALMAGDKNNAWAALEEYLALKRSYLSSRMSRMNHRDMASYWRRSNEGFVDAPLFCLKTDICEGEEVSAVLNAVMFAKSVTINQFSDFRDAVSLSSEDLTKAKYGRLKDCRARIESMLRQSGGNQKGADSLKSEASRLERELRHGLFSEGLLRDTLAYPDWRVTAAAMDRNSVAIEFANFNEGDTDRYCAFIYSKESASPVFVPLCTETELLAIIGDGNNYTREAVEKRFSKENLAKLYGLVWEPFEDCLTPGNEVIFAPSGLLNRIPLEYCGTREGDSVAERCRRIRRVNVSSDAVHSLCSDNFDRIVLFGNVNYYEGGGQRAVANAFAPLPGSKRELAAIKSSLGNSIPVTERSGRNATESEFKKIELQASGHAIIHLSTHGFYLPAESARSQQYYMKYPQETLEEYPLLRSALVMAGANPVWTGVRRPGIDEEDGILTAQEISSLNLKGCSLVVLSACQSGLGDIDSEGVLGMQRGFRMAGAGSMLVSLWPADDAGTAYLMSRFYSALADGLDAYSALRSAVTQMKANPAFASPYFWAPFVITD